MHLVSASIWCKSLHLFSFNMVACKRASLHILLLVKMDWLKKGGLKHMVTFLWLCINKNQIKMCYV